MPAYERIRDPPTQQPLVLLERLIAYSCPPDGPVINPFIGSATTRIAVQRLGRAAIGIEIDERTYGRAAERLDTSTKSHAFSTRAIDSRSDGAAEEGVTTPVQPRCWMIWRTTDD